MSLRTQLESRSNFIILVRSICDRYQLDPTIDTNLINVKAFLKSLDAETILKNSSTIDECNDAIVEYYSKHVDSSEVPSLPDNINATREHLIRVIKTPGDDSRNAARSYNNNGFSNRREGFASSESVGSILEMDPIQRIETIKYLNYKSLHRDEFIIIDSRYQNKVNDDPTKMQFSLIGTTKRKSDHGGVIVGKEIKNIIEIEVYPFTIPYKPMYVTFYNKITLAINEWMHNSFEAYESGQFHIGFDIDRVDNNLIYLRPINPIYTFSSPMNYVDDFTLSFGAMLPKISFDPDRMFPSKIDYSDPLGVFIFSDAHNLVTGDLVHITGFSTPDPARDVDLISDINRAHGHTIVKKDNFSFIINMDLTPLLRENPVNSGIYPILSFVQEVQVFFASKRVQIQMRMRYLTSYT